MPPLRKVYQVKLLDRRSFLKLAGVGGGAAFLAACGQPTTPAPTTAPATSAAVPAVPAATAAPAEVTISFWTPGGSDTWCGGFDTIAKNFQEKEPGIIVTATQCYAGDESFNEVLLANIAAGTPPDATIIWSSPVGFAALDALEPLDALMAASQYSAVENWPAGVLASCQFRGQTFGLPVTAGAYGLYYNQDMFEAKGIPSGRADFPKTWDELRRLSKEFTYWKGDTLETAGYIPWGNPHRPARVAIELAIWAATNGSELFDSVNLKYMLNNEQNIELMQYALDWLNEEYKGDLIKIRTSANWAGSPDSEGRSPAFQDGRLAMFNNGDWFTGDMYRAELKFERWDAASFPVGPSGSKTASGCWPNWMVIPKGSIHVPEAFKYMDYIAGEGVLVWYANVPDTPANLLLPADLVPSGLIEKRGQEFAADVTSFFRHQQEVATPMWTSPVQEFGNDVIGRAIEQILGKQATPKEAMDDAQAQCQAELDRVLQNA